MSAQSSLEELNTTYLLINAPVDRKRSQYRIVRISESDLVPDTSNGYNDDDECSLDDKETIEYVNQQIKQVFMKHCDEIKDLEARIRVHRKYSLLWKSLWKIDNIRVKSVLKKLFKSGQKAVENFERINFIGTQKFEEQVQQTSPYDFHIKLRVVDRVDSLWNKIGEYEDGYVDDSFDPSTSTLSRVVKVDSEGESDEDELEYTPGVPNHCQASEPTIIEPKCAEELEYIPEVQNHCEASVPTVSEPKFAEELEYTPEVTNHCQGSVHTVSEQKCDDELEGSPEMPNHCKASEHTVSEQKSENELEYSPEVTNNCQGSVHTVSEQKCDDELEGSPEVPNNCKASEHTVNKPTCEDELEYSPEVQNHIQTTSNTVIEPTCVDQVKEEQQLETTVENEKTELPLEQEEKVDGKAPETISPELRQEIERHCERIVNSQIVEHLELFNVDDDIDIEKLQEVEDEVVPEVEEIEEVVPEILSAQEIEERRKLAAVAQIAELKTYLKGTSDTYDYSMTSVKKIVKSVRNNGRSFYMIREESGSENEDGEEEDEEVDDNSFENAHSEKSYKTSTTSTTESETPGLEQQPNRSIATITNQKTTPASNKKNKKGKKAKKSKKQKKGPKITMEEVEAIKKKKKEEQDKAFMLKEQEKQDRLQRIKNSDEHIKYRRCAETAFEIEESTNRQAPPEIRVFFDRMEQFVSETSNEERLRLRDCYFKERPVQVQKLYIGPMIDEKFNLLMAFKKFLSRSHRIFKCFLFLAHLDESDDAFYEFECMTLEYFVTGRELYSNPPNRSSKLETDFYNFDMDDASENIPEMDKFVNAVHMVRNKLKLFEAMIEVIQLTDDEKTMRSTYMLMSQFLKDYTTLNNTIAYLHTIREDKKSNLLEEFYYATKKNSPMFLINTPKPL